MKIFSLVAEPLTNLLRKNVAFQWNDACQQSFDELKHRLTSAPILALPSGEGRYVVFTDALSRKTIDRLAGIVCYNLQSLVAL